jgi:hypothetical protein
VAGPERFILVRADATRIFSCCLDYDVERVRVTDIVHECPEVGGTWRMRASTYRKLRLRASAVVHTLGALGLDVRVVQVTPWIHLVATRVG